VWSGDAASRRATIAAECERRAAKVAVRPGHYSSKDASGHSLQQGISPHNPLRQALTKLLRGGGGLGERDSLQAQARTPGVGGSGIAKQRKRHSGKRGDDEEGDASGVLGNIVLPSADDVLSGLADVTESTKRYRPNGSNALFADHPCFGRLILTVP
jgi:hypothetical protein